MTTHEPRIALLIDADNSPAGMIDEILDELAKEGVINIRRAYGNWKSLHLKSWEAVLHDFAIQPIQQFAYTKGKNATDAAMIIDAMDLLYTKQLDGFGIVSSDSDFTPLVMRIRANGLKVFGFGEQKTPLPFVNACSKFLYLETLRPPEETPAPLLLEPALPKASAPPAEGAATPAPPTTRIDANTLRSDTRLVNLLRKSVEAAADEEGWAGLGAVGQHISKQASFDARNYGYAKLSGLFQAIGLFDIRTHGKGLQVRDKRTTHQ
ncbi:MAG: NYN domain-containing protein [Thiobacillus sp.]